MFEFYPLKISEVQGDSIFCGAVHEMRKAVKKPKALKMTLVRMGSFLATLILLEALVQVKWM